MDVGRRALFFLDTFVYLRVRGRHIHAFFRQAIRPDQRRAFGGSLLHIDHWLQWGVIHLHKVGRIARDCFTFGQHHHHWLPAKEDLATRQHRAMP